MIAARDARRAACALAAAWLCGCAQTPTTGGVPASPAPLAPPAPQTPAKPGVLYSLFHRPLKSPDEAVELLRMHASGVQIFRCEMRSGALRWANRLPEAQLRDAAGKVAVRYGADQTFEHVDGSRLAGEVADHVPSPDDKSLPWLLLKTTSYGKGALAGVTYVQRVDTAGGMPPDSCDASQANQLLRVDFSADFVFFH